MIRELLRRAVGRDQRGVVMLLAVPGMVLGVASLALSVDIGRQVLEKRSNQKVADLAALDAARDLPGAQAAAEASAVRNGFDAGAAGHSISTERGSVDAQRSFTVDPAGDAVRVTITSVVDYIFAAGTKSVTARAVAEMKVPPPPPGPVAGFALGSTLASVDTSKAPLLDRVLGKWMRGAAATGGNADVVGWQGLLTADVTMSALRDHLELLDAGVQFGTVNQILDTDVTVADLARATANALSASGNSSAALLYDGPNGVTAQATTTALIDLGDLFRVEVGGGDAFLASRVNAFQLLVGSAMVANGTNLVTVPDIGITVPGLGTTSLSLKVLEGPMTYIGPAGQGVSTSQVELTLTPVLDRPITVAGLVGARLTGAFPFTLTAAGATGTLSSITCASPGAGIRVAVDLKPFSASTTAALTVSDGALVPPVPLFNVAATGGLAVTDPTPEDVDFAYPGEFTDKFSDPPAPKRVGSSPLYVTSPTTFTATATPLGITPVPATLAAVVAADLTQVVAELDDSVMAALHRTLGVSVGVADVAALKYHYDKGCAASAAPPPTSSPLLVG